MPSQSGDANRGRPWGVPGSPNPDLEDVLSRGQDQLKPIFDSWDLWTAVKAADFLGPRVTQAESVAATLQLDFA